MNRYFLFVLFSLLVVVFIVLNINNKITSSLLSTLPNSENKELLETFLKTSVNKKFFLAVKGDDQKSLEKLRKIEQKFLKIEGLEKEQLSFNKKLEEYKTQYQFYLNPLDTSKLYSLEVKQELQKLYQSILNSFFVVSINKNDPFHLLQKTEQKLHIKNGRVFLDDFGYLSIFSLKNEINSLEKYEQLYDEVQKIQNKYQDIITFSPIYYFVENSRYIKKDATIIGILAISLLLVLYFVILRNRALLINTLVALGSSALFAIIVVTSLYQEVSIFVLVFGISISTIAIDYMFHHYFHKHYEEEKGFNKEVFLGFFTTFGVFFILSWSGFILIEQITLFAMASLLFSYLLFSFVFSRIGFIQREFSLSLEKIQLLSGKYIFIFSLIIIGFSIFHLRFDFDITSLNYDNKNLQQKEAFFQQKTFNSDKYTVIIKAKTLEQLIKNNETIRVIDHNMESSLNVLMSQEYFEKRKNELSHLGLDNLHKQLQNYSKGIGFKKDTFFKSYQYQLDYPKFTYEKSKEYGLNIEKYKDGYISFVQVSKEKYEEILTYDFIYSLSVKKLFEKSLQEELDKLLVLGVLSMFFIIVVVISIAKEKSLSALSFLLFPSSLILLYSNFIEINILHLFMFFIILAISIDYGIYSVKNNDSSTQKAILFSALSSFAGFGVLVFSSTNSLYSIGSVATLGIIGILILVFFKKGDDAVKSL